MFGALALLMVGCGDRAGTVLFRTPAECCVPIPPATTCVDEPCPLRALRSVRTELRRSDGTIALERCAPSPPEACTYEDLTGHLLIGGIEPTDGIEVIIEGFSGETCDADPLFSCDAFGDHVVDLRDDPLEVPVWCDCPTVR